MFLKRAGGYLILALGLSTAACSSGASPSESSSSSENDLSGPMPGGGEPSTRAIAALTSALASCGCGPTMMGSAGPRRRVAALCPDTAALAALVAQDGLGRTASLSVALGKKSANDTVAPDGEVFVFRDFTLGIPICAGMNCGLE